VSAELAARRTAARAVLADFRREEPDTDTIGFVLWAGRLAGVLRDLLDELDRAGAG
jgi:hypothetical protein